MKDSQRKAMFAKVNAKWADRPLPRSAMKQVGIDFDEMKLKAYQNLSLKRPLSHEEYIEYRDLAARKFKRMGIPNWNIVYKGDKK